MLSVTTGSKNHVRFSSTWTGADTIGSRPIARQAATLARDEAPCELKLSASQLIVGCFCCLGAFELALWALLKLWLFER